MDHAAGRVTTVFSLQMVSSGAALPAGLATAQLVTLRLITPHIQAPTPAHRTPTMVSSIITDHLY